MCIKKSFLFRPISLPSSLTRSQFWHISGKFIHIPNSPAVRGCVEDVLLQMMQAGMLAGIAPGNKAGQWYAGEIAGELAGEHRVDLLSHDWAGTEQAMAGFQPCTCWQTLIAGRPALMT